MVGPAIVAKTYLPFLEKGRRKVILNVTSGLASIGLDFGAINATYSLSKTALNMLVGINNIILRLIYNIISHLDEQTSKGKA